jgi:hypothetical protein
MPQPLNRIVGRKFSRPHLPEKFANGFGVQGIRSTMQVRGYTPGTVRSRLAFHRVAPILVQLFHQKNAVLWQE